MAVNDYVKEDIVISYPEGREDVKDGDKCPEDGEEKLSAPEESVVYLVRFVSRTFRFILIFLLSFFVHLVPPPQTY